MVRRVGNPEGRPTGGGGWADQHVGKVGLQRVRGFASRFLHLSQPSPNWPMYLATVLICLSFRGKKEQAWGTTICDSPDPASRVINAPMTSSELAVGDVYRRPSRDAELRIGATSRL